jgi:hypothetical protein
VPAKAIEIADQPGRGGNKRCRNQRLHRSGYKLIYPDYRAGYGAMLANR